MGREQNTAKSSVICGGSRLYAPSGPLGTMAHARRRGTVHEMARDEARHGKALKGLLERYFK
jgi:hypothetical protein